MVVSPDPEGQPIGQNGDRRIEKRNFLIDEGQYFFCGVTIIFRRRIDERRSRQNFVQPGLRGVSAQPVKHKRVRFQERRVGDDQLVPIPYQAFY